MIDGERLWRRIFDLGEIGKRKAGGVTPLSFTQEGQAAKNQGALHARGRLLGPRGRRGEPARQARGKESGLTRCPRRPSGIAGVLSVTYVTVQGTTIDQLFPFLPGATADTNIGILALVVNFVLLVVASLATGRLAVRGEQSA
jgi:hypothetical protein